MTADAPSPVLPTLTPDIEAKLDIYEQLLRKWQKAVNLVGPSTLNDIRANHFHNSIQLISYLPSKDITLVDMGSGAGFPGMILAILGVKNVHLIESDTKKAVFLQNVSRETMTPLTVHNRRIEACEIPGIDVITARALASMTDLFGYMHTLDPSGRARGLFLKGPKIDEELRDATTAGWEYTATIHDGLGKIAEITDLRRKNVAR